MKIDTLHTSMVPNQSIENNEAKNNTNTEKDRETIKHARREMCRLIQRAEKKQQRKKIHGKRIIIKIAQTSTNYPQRMFDDLTHFVVVPDFFRFDVCAFFSCIYIFRFSFLSLSSAMF